MNDPNPEPSSSARAIPPDPHGEAALLLVESLIHGLIARSGLTVAEAIEIVQIAADAQNGAAGERGDDPRMRPTASQLLASIETTLRIDAG